MPTLQDITKDNNASQNLRVVFGTSANCNLVTYPGWFQIMRNF